MLQKSINFEIVPVFDQKLPDVWENFAHIESVCDKELFNVQNDKNDYLHVYKTDFHNNKHCFAFVAIQHKKMIGFTHGYMEEKNIIYLKGLYVLPKYQLCGMGTKLLRTAEQSACIIAKKIYLMSLNSAVDFYEQKNGYNHFAYMEKDLKPLANSIIPVFQWVKKDFNVKFNVDINSMFLKRNKYQPIFVHTDEYSNIDGVGVRTVNGENKIWTDEKRLIPILSNTLNNIR